MDGLARLHAAAQPLLARVDATLASHGASADHPVVPLLRRRGLLPGDAVANIVAWEPEPLRQRAGMLRAHREHCASVDGLLRPPSTWEGAAAATFAARLGTVRSEHDTLAANASALSRHLDELADWIAQGRTRLARTLAAAMTSPQCMTLTAAVPATAPIVGAAGASGFADFALTGGGASAGFHWVARLSAVAMLGGGGVPGSGGGLGGGEVGGVAIAAAGLPIAVARAAADLGAELLADVDSFWQGALEISDAWSARLAPIARAGSAAPGHPHTDPGLSVDL